MRFSGEGRPKSQDSDASSARTKLDESGRRLLERLRQMWQRVLPLLHVLGQRITALADRVRRTAGPHVRRAQQRAEPYVGPVRRKLAPAVAAVRAKLPESARHRKVTPAQRSLRVGAAVAAFGVLAVLVGTALPDSEQRNTEPVAQEETLNAPADAPAPMKAPSEKKAPAENEAKQDSGPASPEPKVLADSGKKIDKPEQPPKPELDVGPNPTGIDVSNHNGSIDWNKVAESGKEFTFVLATDGGDFTNPMFEEQYSGSKDAGLATGAYHFGRPGGSAEAQANRFLDTMGSTDDGKTLRPVLDMEVSPNTGGCYGKSTGEMTKWMQSFLDVVKKRTGEQGIIYASPSFWSQCMGGSDAFKNNPLWIAEYGVDKPTVPGGWNKYDFWQFTSKGTVPGIEGPTDINRFKGGGDKLEELVLN